MSVASINSTILAYTEEKNTLTSQLTTIMGKISGATRHMSELLSTVTEKRSYFAQVVAKNPEYADTTEYQVMTQELEADYQLQLADINSWESDLEQQKNNLETRIKVVSNYEESFTQLLKNNIKKDFTYGASGSTSS